jgi:transcription antitermination factor NusG
MLPETIRGAVKMASLKEACRVGLKWYAVQTKSRHEKSVVAKLAEKRIETFLPIIQDVRQWSDRKKSVQVPLFPSYAFVRIADILNSRVEILRTEGVIRIVSSGAQPVPVDPLEIELGRRAGGS